MFSKNGKNKKWLVQKRTRRGEVVALWVAVIVVTCLAAAFAFAFLGNAR